MNNRLIRPIAVIGAFAALAVSSQATITFSGLQTDMSQVGYGDVQIQNPNMGYSGNMFSSGPVVNTESFTLNESGSTVVKATLDEINSGVAGGTLTLTATINNITFYNQTVINTDLTGNTETSLPTSQFTNLSLGAGSYTVTYTATYTGADVNNSYAHIDSFNAFFQETGQNPPPPVPEPASFAVIGVGLIGVFARRRGVK